MSDIKTDIKNFISELKSYNSSNLPNLSNLRNVYNPWLDFDGIYDIGKEAPQIRCRQLENYLSHRVPHAKYIFLAEAVGFQGGHFSGVAMTSERILLGCHKNKNLQPSLAITCRPRRTSNPQHQDIKKTCSELGYNEPTATIVWESIIDHKLNPFDVVLWNIFPFHPYKNNNKNNSKNKDNLLTNRTPTDAELNVGIKYLKMLQNLVPKAAIVTIGMKSHKTLSDFDIKHFPVPHPANGGAAKYRQEIARLFS